MGMGDCFPEWLKRRVAGRIGPPIDDVPPYPVYQKQPLIGSADNNLSPSFNVADAFFDGFSGTVLLAAIPTTIIKITPRNAYDTIVITVFDNQTPPVNNRGAPIFLSMDRPGRITTETPLQQNPEICVCAANAFAVADTSSFPTVVAVPTIFNLGGATQQISNNITFPTPKTNRPFYVWFGDSIQGVPIIAANFSITWYVQGR